LQSIPGIGKKTAGRLIFELKDKIARPLSALEAADDNSLTDVMEALEALGYSRSEVFPLYLQMKERGELSTRLEDNVKLILKKKASLLKR
jgi:Holliday junction DNA helicase RuvA